MSQEPVSDMTTNSPDANSRLSESPKMPNDSGGDTSLREQLAKLKFPITGVMIDGPQKYYTFRGEELERVISLFHQYSQEIAREARLDELNKLTPQPTSLGAFFPTDYIQQRIVELTHPSPNEFLRQPSKNKPSHQSAEGERQ